jgi:methylenetetrahydrofolate dehydrogenase (NAD+)
MPPDAVGKGVLLKVDPIADAFRAEVKDGLAAPHRTPTLVGILATNASPSRFYADFTRKQCEGLGMKFILKEVGSAVKQNEGEEAKSDGDGVEEVIIEANEDDNVDGIMVSSTQGLMDHFLIISKVYYPIFGGQQVRAGEHELASHFRLI